jgi:hypothetical protein
MTTAIELRRRRWVYTQPPATYEIAPCACGNQETEWSEYEGRLWCPICKIDFVPGHNGLFDGPIPVNGCRLMGIYFDRLNLETLQVERFEV